MSNLVSNRITLFVCNLVWVALALPLLLPSAIIDKGTLDVGLSLGCAIFLSLVYLRSGQVIASAPSVQRKGLQEFPSVVSEILGKTYGVAKLLYAVLIDVADTIASMGIINSREHLESLFEAKERKVASLQDYTSKTQAVQ